MATRTVSVAGGNWDAVGTWDEGIVAVAGDAVIPRADGTSGNLTVNVASACTTFMNSANAYTGTITFDATLTITSTTKLPAGATIAGTVGGIAFNGGALSWTSNGKTVPNLTINTAATYTLVDDAHVTGTLTYGIGSSISINFNGNTLTVDGNFTENHGTGTAAGTTEIILGGTGTWSNAGTGPLRNNLTINTAGTITVSGNVRYNTGTLTYTAGTVTTTGSTLNCILGTTLATNGITWADVVFAGTSQSHALSSNLNASGTITVSGATGTTFTGAGSLVGNVTITNGQTFTLNNTLGINAPSATLTLPNAALTINGTAGFDVGALTTASIATSTKTHTLHYGNTYRVRSAISNLGATAIIRHAIVSDTPGSKVALTVDSGATMDLLFCDPTDVDSSGGQKIFTCRGTVTTSTNWTTTVTDLATGGALNPINGLIVAR